MPRQTLLPPDAAASLLEHLTRNGRPPPARQVFVNRTLRMESIRYIGFDLDWTLADYHRLPLEEAIYRLAADRLVDHHGYPEPVRRAEFRPEFPRRGLLIDKEAGTVLRMSRHRFVNCAYRGRQRLGRKQLRELYRYEPIQPSSERFYHLDSLFELPEANLYAELIELGKTSSDLPGEPRQLFDDVRAAIDWVHAGGELKQRVMAETERFLERDPLLGLALRRVALGRRRLVLLTNSDWAYADRLCAYLFNGLLPGLDDWRELFDLVIVRAGKPDFFRQRRPFVELDGAGAERGETETPRWGQVYRGGSLEGLMRLIGEPGETVLYVGDHVYGDIVSSKQESTWRTLLIVRELEEELETRRRWAEQVDRQAELKERLRELGHRMDHLRDLIAVQLSLVEKGAGASRQELAAAKRELHEVTARHKRALASEAELTEEIDGRFNPYWGSFFKQGTSKNRFASQLESYACLYTSRVSNLAYYGSNHYFRVARDPMMHELSEAGVHD